MPRDNEVENDFILLKEVEDNLVFMIQHTTKRILLKRLTTMLCDVRELHREVDPVTKMFRIEKWDE